MKKLKRQLYIAHRWLGISMCLFMAMWFFSGVVMMYVGFPTLTGAERINALPALKSESIKIPLNRFLFSISPGEEIQSLNLTSVLNRPAYLARLDNSKWHGMFADSGEIFTGFNEQDAKNAAKAFSRTLSEAPLNDIQLIEFDQWTISSGLNKFRPLYKVKFDDAAGTDLYVSSVTGTVVRDTTDYERVWNWLGANLHWIYPVVLRQHVSLWVDVIIVLSIMGLIAVISGTIIGFLRLRIKKLYRGTSHTPYSGVMKLHHVLGLGFTIILVTYLFSGLMSMNPWGIFNDRVPSSIQINRYKFGINQHQKSWFASNEKQFEMLLGRIDAAHVKEISWQWIGGRSYLVLHKDQDNRAVMYSDDQLKQVLPYEHIESNVFSLLPNDKDVKFETLEDYDLYYYSHHERFKPLPVLRVRFSDVDDTWYHIDLTTGAIVNRLTQTRRVQRWLYNGLHSFDFRILLDNRPLWDVVVILLCLVGFGFSMSSIAIAVKRIRK